MSLRCKANRLGPQDLKRQVLSIKAHRGPIVFDMFLQYYHLREQPFGVTPDPRYLYPGIAHREALASLVYSFESELGFASLIAEPGLGKTTLLYSLLERFGPATQNAYIFETQCDSRELLRHILSDLDRETSEQDINAMFRSFRDLVAESAGTGRRILIIIDEAQNLAEPVLETVRLLSNFESSRSKLVHIVLAGQPQLAQILARREMAQLRQRITIAARLRPFSENEVKEYIEFRLQVAGYPAAPLFTPEALALITQQSCGIPREINRICFNAMSLGFALDQPTINAELVRDACADLDLGAVLVASSHDDLAASARNVPATPPDERQREQTVLPLRQPVSREVPTTTLRQPADAARFTTRGSVALDSEPLRPPPLPVPVPVPKAPQPVRLRTGVAAPRQSSAEARQQSTQGLKRFSAGKYILIPAATLVVAVGAVALAVVHRWETPGLRQPAAIERHGSETRVSEPVTTPETPPVVEEKPASQPPSQPGTQPPAPEQTLTRVPEHSQARPSGTHSTATEDRIELPPPAATAKSSAPPTETSAPAPALTVAVAPPPALSSLPVSSAPTPAAPDSNIAAAPDMRLETSAADLGTSRADQISPGRLLTSIKPQYPTAAITAHIQGSVVLAIHIGKDGRVTGVHTLKGNRLLAAAATDAVRQWVYTPYTINGEAVEADTTVVVAFSL